MNIFSILRLSFHSLWENKLRTLLTVVVLAVVSFVVVLLAGVGYSFYQSVDKNVGEVYRTNPTVIQSYALVKYQPSGGEKPQTGLSVLTTSQAKALIGVLDNSDGYITGVSFFDPSSRYINGVAELTDPNDPNTRFSAIPVYTGSNPFIGMKNDGSSALNKDASSYLEAGRMWDKNDEGTKNVWLSSGAMGSYSIGDTLDLQTYGYYSGRTGSLVEGSVKALTGLKVAGFLNVGDTNAYSDYMFLDYTNFDQTRPSGMADEEWYGWGGGGMMKINSVYAYMMPQPEYTYGIAAQNYIKGLMKKADAAVTPEGPSAAMATSCSLIDQLKLSTILSIVMIALVIGVSAIIVLLSIGSVANTIKISAEQSRKFFGVMKAIGMKNRNMRHILTGQIIIMTLTGVAIASLAAYLMIGAAKFVLVALLEMLFGFFLPEVFVICSIAFYIPVLVAAALVGIVLLFTRANMASVSKMDVITVINEVS